VLAKIFPDLVSDLLLTEPPSMTKLNQNIIKTNNLINLFIKLQKVMWPLEC